MLFKRLDKIQAELIVLSDMIVSVILIRHGKTESDATGLTPGNIDELLTQEGKEETSRK